MICTFFSPPTMSPRWRATGAIGWRAAARSRRWCARVMDEAGKLLPRGERGEIVVRGALVMAATTTTTRRRKKRRLSAGTIPGTIGVIDEDGFVYIVDRKKDMIISGASTFSERGRAGVVEPSAVQDCAVIGVPDDKWGEAVKAVVELKPGASVPAEELIHLAKRKLGGVKAPSPSTSSPPCAQPCRQGAQEDPARALLGRRERKI